MTHLWRSSVSNLELLEFTAKEERRQSMLTSLFTRAFNPAWHSGGDCHWQMEWHSSCEWNVLFVTHELVWMGSIFHCRCAVEHGCACKLTSHHQLCMACKCVRVPAPPGKTHTKRPTVSFRLDWVGIKYTGIHSADIRDSPIPTATFR